MAYQETPEVAATPESQEIPKEELEHMGPGAL